jgi:hypothetical protein
MEGDAENLYILILEGQRERDQLANEQVYSCNSYRDPETQIIISVG